MADDKDKETRTLLRLFDVVIFLVGGFGLASMAHAGFAGEFPFLSPVIEVVAFFAGGFVLRAGLHAGVI